MTRYGSEREVVSALRQLWPLPSYAVLPGVPDTTGATASRTADALVMSCWPSRGLLLFGIEVKVSRGDWLRELKNPAKAEAVCRYCDHWLIAAGEPGIVNPGELPPTWGLIEPSEKTGKLAVKRNPPKLNPEPMSRGFLASILRSACVEDRSRWDVDIRKAKEDGFKQGKESTKTVNDHETDRYKKLYLDLQKKVDEFQAASGMRISPWECAKELGETVKFVRYGGLERAEKAMTTAEHEAKSILSTVAEYRRLTAKGSE